MADTIKRRALDRLEKAKSEILSLKKQRYSSHRFDKWQLDTLACIANTFGEDSRQSHIFKQISYSPTVFSSNKQEQYNQEGYLNGLDVAAIALASMIDEVKEFWKTAEQPTTTANVLHINEPVDTKKVFIVHGHDHGTKDMVARFIQQLELEPVTLQELPNQGLTVIEKFEQHAEVGFAVVLLTPDDIGAVKYSPDNSKFRARQNVIFELGYLIRHLGRDRVAVLYKGNEGDVEIPSDYAGVLYTQMDGGEGWKVALIREMRAADLEVDANRAL